MREEAEPATLRLALASAASLLFPFAPHVSADAYELLTGRARLGAALAAGRAGAAGPRPYELVCQINGKVRDRVRRLADAAPRSSRRSAARPPRCRRTSRARRSSRRSSCRASS